MINRQTHTHVVKDDKVDLQISIVPSSDWIGPLVRQLISAERIQVDKKKLAFFFHLRFFNDIITTNPHRNIINIISITAR